LAGGIDSSQIDSIGTWIKCGDRELESESDHRVSGIPFRSSITHMDFDLATFTLDHGHLEGDVRRIVFFEKRIINLRVKGGDITLLKVVGGGG
jgi:hypothetical protein